MKYPWKFSRTIAGRRYDVRRATPLAAGEKGGRKTFLYRRKGGDYFVVTLSQWQGEEDCLRPITRTEALELYERELAEHYVPHEQAFPATSS